MTQVTTEELAGHIGYTVRGIKSLKERNIITPIINTDRLIYDLEVIKRDLGIPPDRLSEDILNASQADELILKFISRDRFKSLPQSGMFTYKISTQLSKAGYIDSYYFREISIDGDKTKNQIKGKNILFLKSDILKFIEDNRHAEICYYKVSYIEDMIRLIASYCDPKEKQIITHYLQGLSSRTIAVKLNTHQQKISVPITKFKASFADLVKSKVDPIEEVHKLRIEKEQLQNKINFLQEFIEKQNKKQKVQEIPTIDSLIESLDISVRNKNSCKYAGINTINDLVNFKSFRYRVMRNVGMKAFLEMDQLVNNLGLLW